MNIIIKIYSQSLGNWKLYLLKCCLICFPIAIIKHQGNLLKGKRLIWAYGLRVRVHGGRLQAWWQEQLRVYILISK